MDRKNDNEKIIEDAISGTTEDGGNVENTVDLFELAAKSGETSYTPAPEDIFVIGEPETDTVSYPEVFAEDDEIFLPESEDDHEVFLSGVLMLLMDFRLAALRSGTHAGRGLYADLSFRYTLREGRLQKHAAFPVRL